MKKRALVFSLVLSAIALTLYFRQKELPNQPSPSSPTTSDSGQTFKSNIYKQISSFRQQRKAAPMLRDELKHESKNKFAEAMKLYGKDTDHVIRALEQAIELDPDNTSALGMLAGIYLNQGKKDDAKRLASDCIAVNPKSSDCHTTLISTYTRYGEFDEAYPVLSDCLQEDPDNVHCLGGMETYYLHGNQSGEAKLTLDRLLKLDPDSTWTLLAAGSYYEKVGDIDAAKRAFQKACDMGQPFACSHLKQL